MQDVPNSVRAIRPIVSDALIHFLWMGAARDDDALPHSAYRIVHNHIGE